MAMSKNPLRKKTKEELGAEIRAQAPATLPSTIPPPAPAPVPSPTFQVPQVIRDQDTGAISGVTTTTGGTYLGKPRDIQPLIESQVQKLAPVPGAQELAQVRQQELATQMQTEALQDQPRAKELSPEIEASLDKVPILGPMSAVLSNVFGDLDIKILQRRKALTKIEKQVFKEGQNMNEKFGAIIESIPIAGVLISKYARGLINTPAGTVDEITRQIRIMRESSLQQQKIGALSPELRELALTNVNDMEQNLDKLEAQIKLNVIYSASLRANPATVDTIEQEILRTRTSLQRVRGNILAGVNPISDEEIIAEALR